MSHFLQLDKIKDNKNSVKGFSRISEKNNKLKMDENKEGGAIDKHEKINGERFKENWQQHLSECPKQNQNQEELPRLLPKQHQKQDPHKQQQPEFQRYQLPKQQQQPQQSDADATEGMTGWQVAYRGIQLALNNEVEEALKLLKGDSTCIHRQAGFCYLTFIVSFFFFLLPSLYPFCRVPF